MAAASRHNQPQNQPPEDPEIDAVLAELQGAKQAWAEAPVATRIALLSGVRDGVLACAKDWAETSAVLKGRDPQSADAGEEWLSGPRSLLASVQALIKTLHDIDGNAHIDGLKTRRLATGQLGVEVLPASKWDRILFSGLSAEVWMQPGVTAGTLKQNAASAYARAPDDRIGHLALVLGAGNISSIAPLDVLSKLIIDLEVVVLKLNPVNAAMAPIYRKVMAPFIDHGVLRIVTGDGAAGAYLCAHPKVDTIHITGSEATHDAIVWGVGAQAQANRAAAKPKLTKPITSELGCVSPTLVVPGPWSAADIRYQAKNLATMKLHNSGHNCIAMQVLILPEHWPHTARLVLEFRQVIATSTRPAWYPGTQGRLRELTAGGDQIDRAPDDVACVLTEMTQDSPLARHEVFGPGLGIKYLGGDTAEAFLRGAIAYANSALWGSLGANIVIHPDTVAEIGAARFEEILGDLRYGAICINGWVGAAFSIPGCPWGAYPGNRLDDIGSGIGTVHNANMLENTEKVVLRMPWRPFPRGVLSGQWSLFPTPPFFITNRRQSQIGRALVTFEHSPSWSKLLRVIWPALRG